ncbi:MAG: hypothetical protein ACTHYC_04395 [Sphingobacterium sp.]
MMHHFTLDADGGGHWNQDLLLKNVNWQVAVYAKPTRDVLSIRKE